MLGCRNGNYSMAKGAIKRAQNGVSIVRTRSAIALPIVR